MKLWRTLSYPKRRPQNICDINWDDYKVAIGIMIERVPCMGRTVAIGIQNFEEIIANVF